MLRKARKTEKCASGTVVVRRLAKAKIAGSIPVSRSLERGRKRSVYLCFRSFILLEILGTNGDKLGTDPFHAALM